MDKASRFGREVSTDALDRAETMAVGLQGMAGQAKEALKEEMEQKSCKSLPFTIIFWLVFVISQMGHRHIDDGFDLQRSVVKSLTQAQAFAPEDIVVLYDNETNATNSTGDAMGRRLLAGGGRAPNSATVRSTLSLDSVTSLSGILNFVESNIVPHMWTETYAGRGVLLDFNRVIGGVRLQQTRLPKKDCNKWVGMDIIYNMSCYDELQTETAPIGTTPWESGFKAGDDKLYTFWLDIAQNETQVVNQIQHLRDHGWLSPAMSALKLQAVLYNAQVKLMAVVQMDFTYGRTGTMTTKGQVMILPTEVYGSNRIVAGDFVLVACITWLMFGEIWKIGSACRNGTCCTRETLSPIRFLNLMLVFIGGGFTMFFIFLWQELKKLGEGLANTPLGPDPLDMTDWGYNSLWDERHVHLNKWFDRTDTLAWMVQMWEQTVFWYTMLLMLKFFEAFEASDRLAVITKTLRECMTDVSHFLLVFGIVFMNFCLGAHFLFGQQIKDWSTPLRMANTGFRCLMGDFDFNEMYSVDPIGATIWFWLFMTIIFIVMLNMLLAIILDVYTRVKDENSKGQTLWAQAASMAQVLLAKNKVHVPKRKPSLLRSMSNEVDVVDIHNPGSVDDSEPAAGAGLRAAGSAVEEIPSKREVESTILDTLVEDVKKLAEQLSEVNDLPMRFQKVEKQCEQFQQDSNTKGSANNFLLRPMANPLMGHGRLANTHGGRLEGP